MRKLTVTLLLLILPGGLGMAQDTWQRRLELVGWSAMFFATGCGTDLQARHSGDAGVIANYADMGIGMDAHRRAHATASGVALSAYLGSGYLQLRVNLQRPEPALRHRVHNGLFLVTGLGLVTTAVTGVLSTQAYEEGNRERGKDLADMMKLTANVSCSIGLADLLFFGGRDNSSPLRKIIPGGSKR